MSAATTRRIGRLVLVLVLFASPKVWGQGVSQLMQKTWDGTRWLPSPSEWTNLRSAIESDPVVASWGANRLDIFKRGSDGAVYQKAWDGTRWAPSLEGWTNLGGNI